MKSVTEKGFPASLNYAVTRGKGEFSFRFSQLVTAASYSEADVSARPNSLNLFTDLCREQRLKKSPRQIKKKPPADGPEDFQQFSEKNYLMTLAVHLS